MPRIALGLMISVWIAIPLSAQLEVTTTGVGIGTTSPATKLEVVGDGSDSQDVMRITRGTGNSSRLQLGHSYLQRYNSSNVAADLYLNLNGGNVGIGTAAPSTRLHVNGGDVTISDVGSGNVASLSLDSHTGAGDIGFLTSGSLKFLIRASTDGSGATLDLADRTSGHVSRIYVAGNGSVGIGTSSPSYPLHVNGSVRATSFISNSTTYADFVFKPGYRLAPLSEVEAHIQTKGHLPDIPSEAEAKANGIDLAAMQVKLLQKVEELTLYVVDQNKRIEGLQAELTELKAKSNPTP